jgi:hypothetical protein
MTHKTTQTIIDILHTVNAIVDMLHTVNTVGLQLITVTVNHNKQLSMLYNKQ